MKKIIKIEGMSCQNCVKHVDSALKGVEGVKDVKVSLKDKNAVVKIDDTVSDEILTNAVKEAGYKPVSIEVKKGLF